MVGGESSDGHCGHNGGLDSAMTLVLSLDAPLTSLYQPPSIVTSPIRCPLQRADSASTDSIVFTHPMEKPLTNRKLRSNNVRWT
jgi:hypothetical protein